MLNSMSIIGQSYMLVDQMECMISQVGEKGETDNADNWWLSGHLQLFMLTDLHCVANVVLNIVLCCDFWNAAIYRLAMWTTMWTLNVFASLDLLVFDKHSAAWAVHHVSTMYQLLTYVFLANIVMQKIYSFAHIFLKTFEKMRHILKTWVGLRHLF